MFPELLKIAYRLRKGDNLRVCLYQSASLPTLEPLKLAGYAKIQRCFQGSDIFSMRFRHAPTPSARDCPLHVCEEAAGVCCCGWDPHRASHLERQMIKKDSMTGAINDAWLFSCCNSSIPDWSLMNMLQLVPNHGRRSMSKSPLVLPYHTAEPSMLARPPEVDEELEESHLGTKNGEKLPHIRKSWGETEKQIAYVILCPICCCYP